MTPAMRIRSSAEESFLSARQWDDWVQKLPSGHLLQSWAWGDLKARFGWQPLRLAAIEEDRVLAATQVLFRPLLAGQMVTAYVPKGPLADRSLPLAAPAAALVSELHAICRRKRAVSLKLEPDWTDGTDEHNWLQAQGFVPSEQTIQPRRTVVIDLMPSEEAILSQMKSKTRYNIRLAQRKGVSVRLGTGDDLTAFYQMLRITGRRAGFGIHTLAYYQQAWQLFDPQGAVALLLARYNSKPLAAIMVFAWGKKAYYLYGASSDEERHRMPTYLVQWEAMRWAKARGCETYDLWGIPDVDSAQVGPDVAKAEALGVLSTGMGGLYRFKRGFGGKEIRYVGAYDYVYNGALYRLLTTAWDWRGR
jgi:lipid II:glycine glycyltransferase (peptidoglycan interpeptide bridge formation enzyme)